MKYERITGKRNDGTYYIKKCNKVDCDGHCCCCDFGFDEELREHLGHLEDKIENGTLVELPCKVGTKIYIVGESDFCIPKYQMWEDEFCLEDVERFGDTVFITKDEAEKRLQELRGEV